MKGMRVLSVGLHVSVGDKKIELYSELEKLSAYLEFSDPKGPLTGKPLKHPCGSKTEALAGSFKKKLSNGLRNDQRILLSVGFKTFRILFCD